jgi:hypothetical protein
MLMVESATKLLEATVLCYPWGLPRPMQGALSMKHKPNMSMKHKPNHQVHSWAFFMYNKIEQLLHAIDDLRQRPTPLVKAVCVKPTWNSKCFKHSNGNTNHLNSKTIFREKVTKHKTHVPTKLF